MIQGRRRGKSGGDSGEERERVEYSGEERKRVGYSGEERGEWGIVGKKGESGG